MANEIVKYEVGGQEIKLDPMTVRKYLVNGGGNVSDQEVMMFIKLCQGQQLNPFTREAYLVKYGSQAASIVVGKDTFTRRAENNQDYKGSKSGIIVINMNGQLDYREGTFYMKNRNEELVGGWARVFFKSDKTEVFNTVSLDEYIGKKKDGEITSMWKSKPATMIRKVALVQALREAFPNALNQMYTEEEMNIQDELPKNEINPEEELRNEKKVDDIPVMASKLEKQQVMQLATEKNLITGTGRNADITKLLKLAEDHHINLKKMTSTQAKSLIFILQDYKEEVIDVSEEDVKPVEDTEIEENNSNENTEDINALDEEEEEENPF